VRGGRRGPARNLGHCCLRRLEEVRSGTRTSLEIGKRRALTDDAETMPYSLSLKNIEAPASPSQHNTSANGRGGQQGSKKKTSLILGSATHQGGLRRRRREGSRIMTGMQ